MKYCDAEKKAIKYYRRWTLGLIPVTMIIPDIVFKRALKYMEDEVRDKND